MAYFQRTSAGAVIKKIHEINPSLGVIEISKIVRGATTTRKGELDDAGDVEVIDEERALQMARNTLKHEQSLS